MNLPGSELYFDPTLSFLERWYCRLFGVPIVGLRIRLRRIARLLPPSADRILDAGCGRGVMTRYLAWRYPGAQIEGVDGDRDVQERNRRIASAVGLSRCSFIDADLCGFRNLGAYDLIVSVDNLEHIDDDASVLANFFDALRPDGLLLVHVPHYYRRWPILKWSVNFDVPGHFRPGYHLPELTERLERAGFEVVDFGFSYGFVENLANNLSYLITGAREQRKYLYALFFPLLNIVAAHGYRDRPAMGAGVWALARKKSGAG